MSDEHFVADCLDAWLSWSSSPGERCGIDLGELVGPRRRGDAPAALAAALGHRDALASRPVAA
jgi:hypothetical protein